MTEVLSLGGVKYLLSAETVVNKTTDGNQAGATVVALADGRFAVTWTSGTTIYTTAFDADFTVGGNEETTLSTQGSKATSLALDDGGYVVFWREATSIKGKLVDSQGGVHSLTGANNIGTPHVAALSDGGFVVAWTQTDGCHTLSYNAGGTTRTAVLKLDGTSPTDLSVVGLAGGGYALAWQEGSDVVLQRYEGSGSASGAAVRLTASGVTCQKPVLFQAGSDLGLAWMETANGANSIHYEVFKSDGTVKVAATTVDTSGTPSPSNPNAIGFADGTFMLTWSSAQSDIWTTLYAQKFGATGVASGTAAAVSTDTGITNGFSTATLLDNGNIFLGWDSSLSAPVDGGYPYTDGDGTAVVGRLMVLEHAPVAAGPAPAVGVTPNQSFSVSVGTLFSDTDIGDELSFDAVVVVNGNQQALPSWISLSPSGTLTGTPPADFTGTLSIRIKATDLAAEYAVSSLLLMANGGAGADVITGGAGDDTIDGGAGVDKMTGGKGNDVYIVDSAKDAVVEKAGEGVDEVRASVTYTLAANVENLVLADGFVIDGTGNALDNVITGNTLANKLAGLAGNDTLIGGGGNDSLDGGAGCDVAVFSGDSTDYTVASLGSGKFSVTSKVDGSVATVTTVEIIRFDDTQMVVGAAVLNGTDADDTIIGGDAADTLKGGAGGDTLDGGAGADNMAGGLGDDVYVVDNAKDKVVEAAGEGTDTITTALGAFTLDKIANVENLTYVGSDAFSGAGNALNNVITGDDAGDKLSGGGGDDTLIGLGGDDLLEGGIGSDTLSGGSGTDIAYYGGSKVGIVADLVTLSVRDSATTTDRLISIEGIYGSAGPDVIGGNSGANQLYGAGGNDTMRGGAGDDYLSGGAGNDILQGDAGNDALDGGAGNDVFLWGVGGLDGNVTVTDGGGTDMLAGVWAHQMDAMQVYRNGADLVFAQESGSRLRIVGEFAGKAPVVETVAWTNDRDGLTRSMTVLTTVVGKATNDLMVGTDAAETLSGNAGDDEIWGGSGADTVDGGVGRDMLHGGAGNDVIYGGEGDDLLVGDGGDDWLLGGAGTDWAGYIGATAGVQVNADSSDRQIGEILYQAHKGTGDGTDTLVDIEGIWGSRHDDVLIGATVIGMDGADTLVGLSAGGSVASYADDASGIIANLTSSSFTVGDATIAADSVQDGWDDIDTLIGISGIIGSRFDDIIKFAEGWAAGGRGDDTITGDGVDSLVYYGLDGETSGVVVNLGATPVTVGGQTVVSGTALDGSGGVDVLNGITGVVGGKYADVLVGNAGDNLFVGGGGADTITGGAGHDTVDYSREAGTGGVAVNLSDTAVKVGKVTLQAGQAVDSSGKIDLLSGIEEILGTSFNDVFVGGAGAEVFRGLQGDDTMTGKGGADTFVVGVGKDVIADFNAAEDHVIVTGSGWTLDEILAHTAQAGANVVISLSATNIVTLNGVTLSNLTTGWLSVGE
ncbi:MAG: beta strand repeat-containing protein [Solirubrobacterales bacterium]